MPDMRVVRAEAFGRWSGPEVGALPKGVRDPRELPCPFCCVRKMQAAMREPGSQTSLDADSARAWILPFQPLEL